MRCIECLLRVETMSSHIELRIISTERLPITNFNEKIHLKIQFSWEKKTFRRFQFHIGKWLKFNIYWRRCVGTNYQERGRIGIGTSSIANISFSLLIFHSKIENFPRKGNSLNPHKSLSLQIGFPGADFHVASNFTFSSLPTFSGKCRQKCGNFSLKIH